MTIFQDSILVVIFILLFFVFLGVCAFTAWMYQIQQTKETQRRIREREAGKKRIGP